MWAAASHPPKWSAGVVGMIVFGLDQWTKLLVRDAFASGRGRRGIDLVGDFIELKYVENRGAAFGVLRGEALILSLLAIVVVVGLAVYFAKTVATPIGLTIGIGLIFGGAIGNLVDRIRLGFVVDFISVGAWPTFNLADSAISVGVAAFVFGVLRDDGQPRTAMRPPERSPAAADPGWSDNG